MTSEQPEYSTREELLEVLFDRIAADAYPSTTMLNLAEELLTQDDVPAYTELLLNKVAEEPYPSIPMLNRIHRLG